MPDTHIAFARPSGPDEAGAVLCRNPAADLTLGIDNIHYDVFLSPRFVEFTRKYLLDLIRQTINVSLVYGKDEEAHGPPEHGAFRKMLTEILQESLIGRSTQQSIETDVLHQLAILKYPHDGTSEPVFEHRWSSARNGFARAAELSSTASRRT